MLIAMGQQPGGLLGGDVILDDLVQINDAQEADGLQASRVARIWYREGARLHRQGALLQVRTNLQKN